MSVREILSDMGTILLNHLRKTYTYFVLVLRKGFGKTVPMILMSPLFYHNYPKGLRMNIVSECMWT